MEHHTVRHTVTTGKFTLPCAYVLSAVLWSLTSANTTENWTGFLFLAVTTFFLRTVYNNVSLIRIRSWFLSSCFIVLCACMPFLHTFDWTFISLFSFIIAQHFLFKAYQNTHAERPLFFAFLFLFSATLFCPPVILLTPAFLLAIMVPLRAFTLRTASAILLALILVAQVLLWYHIATDSINALPEFWISLTDIHFKETWQWSTLQMVNVIFIGVFLFLSIIHFYRTFFYDKIRTRMYFHVIILETICCAPALLSYPDYFNALLRLLLLLCAPLYAHYFVLGQGRFMDYFFLFSLAASAALALFNVNCFP